MPTNLTLSGLHKELSETNSISDKLSLIHNYYTELYLKPRDRAMNDFENEYLINKKKKEKELRSDLENHIKSSDSFETIEKLTKEKFTDPLQIFINHNILEKHKIDNEIFSCFFGNGVAYHSFIPEDIFKLHFHDSDNNIEFKYWFFNYWSNLLFEVMVNSKDFQSKLNSKKALIFLTAELTEIQNFDNRVNELILKENISTEKKTLAFQKEIEYIRVIDDYYKTNRWDNNHDATLCKAKYILFKSYLEKEIEKLKQKSVDNNPTLKTNLKTNLPNINLKCLYNLLISGDKPFFDHKTDNNSFLYAFGAIDNIEEFFPLVWVKTQEKKKTKEVNIRSFIDLLELLEIDFLNTDNKKLIEKLFNKKNKNGDINPMKFQPRHFDIDSKTRQRKTSEFFDILQSMITKCKSNK